MKIKCIKTYAYHWGNLFDEGKFYEIVKTDMREYEMIVDKTKYINLISKISESGTEIQYLLKDRDFNLERLNEIKKENDGIQNEVNGYIIKVKIPTAYLPSDLPTHSIKYGWTSNNPQLEKFCMYTHKELLNNYGTSDFHYTVNILEDYFDVIPILRDNKINKILNGTLY